jgi:hypothetical protein
LDAANRDARLIRSVAVADASAVLVVAHLPVGPILVQFLARGRDYRPSALDAKEFAAVAMNSLPKHLAARLVAACQLADDSLAPVHLGLDEPSAVLEVRQSWLVAALASVPPRDLFLNL